MSKRILGMASATAMLLGAASAGEIRDYIISAQNAPIKSMASAIASDSQFARLNAIYSTNLQMASDAARAGVHITQQLTHVGAISFAKMTEEQARELKELGYVAELSNTVTLYGFEQPFPGITNGRIELAADTVPYGIEKVEADQIWDKATGAGVKVCIMDTGLDTDHPDLASNYVMGTRTSNIGQPDSRETTPEDGHGHGTHVAGTVAANLDGKGIVGVAPNAELYIAAIFGASGSTSEQAVIAGVDWCVAQNTRVANMSYGGPNATTATKQAYQEAYDYGLVMVAATGNSGASTPIGYPAAYDTTIAVGATDRSDNIARFSQRGETIDLVAPGYLVPSAKVGGGTTRMSGTSMATPHVAGAVASILEVAPNLSVEEVRSVLRDTADDVGPAGFDTTFGAGRLNVRKAIESLEGNDGGGDDGGDGDTNRPPSASFSYEADLLTVSFNDRSTDLDGEVVAWEWSFGDGVMSTEISPVHTYGENGDYTVTLKVTDDQGASQSTSQTLSVNDGTLPEIEVTIGRGGFWIFAYDIVNWTGAKGKNVDVYRNGKLEMTTPNDGKYLSYNRRPGSVFKVCEAGSVTQCSEDTK